MLLIKNNEQLQKRFFLSTLIVLFFLFISRTIAMWLIPLNDSSEARYAEIARKMLETGNWVTLQHDYGVPFWAKPPLSTWLSALSMKYFGINEFAVRLPGLILSLGVVWLIWDLAKKQSGIVVGRVTALVLAGSFYFFLDAGTVMTDPALLFCLSLAMVAFWHGFHGSQLWSYVFFIALGLGLLAKGPIALVLIGMPIFFWVLLRGKWSCFWHRFPWFKGLFITIVIALPWYILAEMRTPGFLHYFIVGEHINRFLVPGWAGDKYGSAHNQAWGMIWLYALLGIFPWSVLGTYWAFKYWKKTPVLLWDEEGWVLYLILCVCLPLLFFTFASNIIYTYAFPSMPAFALLFGELWKRSHYSFKSVNWILISSLWSGLIFLLVTFIFMIKPQLVAKTQKELVQTWMQQKPFPGSSLIYWDYKTEFSAQFYSAGRVRSTTDQETLRALLLNALDNYLVINEKELNNVPKDLISQCNAVKTVYYKENKLLLYHCPEFILIA